MRSASSARDRREFLLGAHKIPRPPWSSEISIRNACTGCGDCIAACPEAILIKGRGATPAVDFSKGECTFCGACAEACAEEVFAPRDTAPWQHTVAIEAGCMMNDGISCQICTDACPQTALRVDLSHRPVGAIMVDNDACNGCGACISACPVAAIRVGA